MSLVKQFDSEQLPYDLIPTTYINFLYTREKFDSREILEILQ